MGRAEKVVLAYSGGVNASVCVCILPLKQEWAVKDAITLAVCQSTSDKYS
jgi:argininosuccinate synthase